VTVTSDAAGPRPGAPAGLLRRWGLWLLLAAVVAVAVVIGLQPRSHPTVDQRAASIGNRVRCPVCEGQNVNQSDTPPADAIKAEISSELAAGRSSQQILDGIERSYGPGILERPPASGVDLLVWVLPVIAVAAGAAGLVVAFRRWRPARAPAGPGGTAASAADRRLVEDALGPGGGPGASGVPGAVRGPAPAGAVPAVPARAAAVPPEERS
jgi:cytochrome c-type biogenesis protein CcmH